MIACGRCGTWAHIACLAKHDKTRKSMKAWENVDYTCRNCIARAQNRPPSQHQTQAPVHFTIDHDKERVLETHKRPWMEAGHQPNPSMKYTKPNDGPMGHAPPRVPVFKHHTGYPPQDSPRGDAAANNRYAAASPIQFHFQNGHNGQPSYGPGPASAPPPPHGYSLPPRASISHPNFPPQLPPLQSRPPQQPVHNQLPHLNPILPSANNHHFAPSNPMLNRPQHGAFTPLPNPSQQPTLPPMQHQAPPYPLPATTSYPPAQGQYSVPRPMPSQQPSQQQG